MIIHRRHVGARAPADFPDGGIAKTVFRKHLARGLQQLAAGFSVADFGRDIR